MRKGMIAIAVVSLVCAGAMFWPGEQPVQALCQTGNGSTTLDVPVRDRSGVETSLRQYAGHVVLLNVWATWCPPCRIEMPALQALHRRYAQAGVAVVGVSSEDSPEEMDELARELEVDYPLYSAFESVEMLEEHLGPVYGLPTTFLIAQDGRICEVIPGLRSERYFEELLDRYMPGT